jgi:hypothetical protein
MQGLVGLVTLGSAFHPWPFAIGSGTCGLAVWLLCARDQRAGARVAYGAFVLASLGFLWMREGPGISPPQVPPSTWEFLLTIAALGYLVQLFEEG